MPVPQRVDFLWNRHLAERARCPFHKKIEFCGTAILPVLENGERCKLKPIIS
jgi:hypothetical protein